MSIYDIEVKTITGQTQKMSEYKGKVLLIVNTASACGFTPQYEGLEELYNKYAAQGLVVMGFPCNQFGGQEPGEEKEIATFCKTQFGIQFPMFAKVDVNGPNTHPLFEFLKSNKKGLLGTEAVKWNFTKFLIDREGNVVRRYAPQEKPQSIQSDIEALL